MGAGQALAVAGVDLDREGRGSGEAELAAGVGDGVRVADSRDPLICFPGGAMREPVYLGDLGGPADVRPLVVRQSMAS